MPLELTQPAGVTTPAEPPPSAAMLQLLFGKHITYSISAVARLGVPDHMGSNAVEIETLARSVKAQPQALYRVMRMLTGVGVFQEEPGSRFVLTPLGELLKSDAPGSLRYFAIQLGDPWTTRAWEHFTNTIRTGVDGVTQAFGKNVFDLFADEPEQADHFNRSMTQLSAAVIDPIANTYDFSSIRRLADVGGGHGILLSAVLNRYPHMQGVVYDLPEVVAGTLGQPHFAGCQDRVQVEAGNFFEKVPAGCDAYMMKFILHDWSDDLCIKILNCVREQLPPDGRVLAFEQVVTAEASLSPAKLLDIEMLALTVGGKERTEVEFAELFSSAGLRLTYVSRTASPVCILEARLA